jgi:potassium-transporting ATPase potassium-binding subunit
VQTAGLAVQNFVSAAVGIAVAVALVRGFARSRTGELGNFWADLVRGTIRILVPGAAIAAVVLVACGAIQNFAGIHEVGQFMGGSQQWNGGAVASQEAIKEFGTNGGGYFNANSAHPFENPGPVSDIIEIVLMLLIPVSFIRTFGVMIGDRRQGWALLTVAAVLFAGGMLAMGAAETLHHGTAAAAAGSAAEGTETRFGVPASALFGQSATASADGAANVSYDSFAGLGGGILLANMMLGEVSPGGAGSGLYGLLVVVMLAVFLGGLMIGRTPEYLTKRLGGREMKFVSLYILTAPLTILIGTAIAMGLPGERRQMGNTGAHGLSEVLYAFTSSGASNGSAFGGFTGNTTWYNAVLALVMLIGRYLPMIFVLALAGSLAAQRPGVVTTGTLRTHTPTFIALVITTTLIVVGLEYFPALALGPLAEGVG